MIKDQNVSYLAGDSASITVAVDDKNGVAMDLSVTTVTWYLRKNYSSDPLITKTTTEGGITIAGEDHDQAIIALTPADTENLLGSYVHEMAVEDALLNNVTVMRGSFVLEQ